MDPFTRKDWYDVKAPSMFTNRQVGKTLVNRTQGTKIASEGLKSRVFEVSLADLQSDSDAERSFRKFRLIAEDVQGKNAFIYLYFLIKCLYSHDETLSSHWHIHDENLMFPNDAIIFI